MLRALPITAALVLSAPPAPSAAAELVMFEQDFCPWCEAWNAEIADIYPKTAEGALMPLRRADIENPAAADVELEAPVRYTPTFVVVDEGVEIGRVTGYTGEDQFWGLLGQIASRLEARER